MTNQLLKVIDKYKKLSNEVKASMAYTVCSILTKCLSLITLPIFTRMMSTNDFGLSTVYASSSAIVAIFTSLQLPYGTLNTAMIKFKDDREGYISSICCISAVLAFIYIVFCVVYKSKIVKWLDLPFFLILLMGAETFFTTTIAAWMGYQRFESKYKNVVFITLGSSIVSVIFSLIFVMFSSEKGIARVCSNSFVVCAVGLAIFISLLVKGKKPFDKKYWKFALSFNIPLIPYYLSQVVFNEFDRLMIDDICGRTDAAIYGIAYTLATGLIFVVSSINNSYTPWIFERIDKKELKDSRNITVIISIGIAFMLLGIIALAPEIIYLLAGEEYTSAVWAVPPIAMSVLLLYYADLFDCILFFYESKFCLIIATIASAITNVVLNYVFIPRFGFVAAAYTTFVSYFILASIDYCFMQKKCNMHGINKDIYNIKWLVVIFVIFASLGFIAMSLYRHTIIRYSIVVLAFIILLSFRNKIIDYFKIVRRTQVVK